MFCCYGIHQPFTLCCGIHHPFTLLLWNPPSLHSVAVESTIPSLCCRGVHHPFTLLLWNNGCVFGGTATSVGSGTLTRLYEIAEKGSVNVRQLSTLYQSRAYTMLGSFCLSQAADSEFHHEVQTGINTVTQC